MEPDCVSVLAKLSGARIKLEVAKALGQGRLRSLCHDPPRFARSLTPQGASGQDRLLILVHRISGTGDPFVSLRFPGACSPVCKLFYFIETRDDLFSPANEAPCIEVVGSGRQD